MAHQKYRIRKALAAIACTISAAIVVAAVASAYRDTHAAPITVAPAVALSSAVQARARTHAETLRTTAPSAGTETLRTPVFPAEVLQPRTVIGPTIDEYHTYHTTYLYNPSRVCTAIITRNERRTSLSCVLVPE